MTRPDEFRVTFEQNPAMKEALRDASPGTKIEVELHATVKSMDAEGVVLTAEAVVPEGWEIDEEGEKEPAMPAPPESMMTPTAMLVRRKRDA